MSGLDLVEDCTVRKVFHDTPRIGRGGRSHIRVFHGAVFRAGKDHRGQSRISRLSRTQNGDDEAFCRSRDELLVESSGNHIDKVRRGNDNIKCNLRCAQYIRTMKSPPVSGQNRVPHPRKGSPVVFLREADMSISRQLRGDSPQHGRTNLLHQVSYV